MKLMGVVGFFVWLVGLDFFVVVVGVCFFVLACCGFGFLFVVLGGVVYLFIVWFFGEVWGFLTSTLGSFGNSAITL